MREAKNKTLVRTQCSPLEIEIANKLSFVKVLPASFDKRFLRDIQAICNSSEGITEKQREIMLILFKKYRRQISNYEDLSLKVSSL